MNNKWEMKFCNSNSWQMQLSDSYVNGSGIRSYPDNNVGNILFDFRQSAAVALLQDQN